MIDSHLHLHQCVGELSAQELLDELRLIGVSRLMVNGTLPEDWGQVKELSLEYPEVIPSFGVHPWNVAKLPSNWLESLTDLLGESPSACVGEIGLDKWIAGHDLALQKEILMPQLALAHRLARPVTFHCLQAWGSLLECFDASDYRRPFLLHSYGGPQEMVDEWVARGAYFSVSGYFFRPVKSAKLKVFESIPPTRILLETDAPDMALAAGDEKYRREGIANHPGNLEVVYECYARWTGATLEEVRRTMQENFTAFLAGDHAEAA